MSLNLNLLSVNRKSQAADPKYLEAIHYSQKFLKAFSLNLTYWCLQQLRYKPDRLTLSEGKNVYDL